MALTPIDSGTFFVPPAVYYTAIYRVFSTLTRLIGVTSCLVGLRRSLASINSETVPDIDPNKVNLEHILPANPSDEWSSEFSDEDFRSYCNRLGNLAIMASRINSSLGNNAFPSKRDAYSDSSFHFTKMIYTETEWTKQAIEKRQEAMSEVAIKYWTL